MKVAFDATQRDYECFLRTGVEGEEDQGIFINEPPHKWNLVHKCTLDSCPLFFTEAEGACSCVFDRLLTVAARPLANDAVLPLSLSSASSALPMTGSSTVQPPIAMETGNEVISGMSLSSAGSLLSVSACGECAHGDKIVKGDVVSVCPTLFDGEKPGSFSMHFPERCFGRVITVHISGLVTVLWENGSKDKVKLTDLKKESTHTLGHAIY